MMLYHATFMAHVPSIISFGLGAIQLKNWEFSEENMTYFASEIDIAFSFCEAAEDTPDNIYDSGIVLFSIESKYLTHLEKDNNIRIPYNDDSDILYFKTRDVIPYEKLTKVFVMQE